MALGAAGARCGGGERGNGGSPDRNAGDDHRGVDAGARVAASRDDQLQLHRHHQLGVIAFFAGG